MIPFDPVDSAWGDDIELAFAVKDKAKNAVTVDSAHATFRIARKGSKAIVLMLSDQDSAGSIVLAGSTATVSFNADELPCPGTYTGQLRITLSGKTMVSAEGDINVAPLIGQP